MSLLIVAYLFLGGAGAGAFAVLALIDVRYVGTGVSAGLSKRSRKRAYPNHIERRYFLNLTKRGYIASFVALCLGAICLLADLGRPEIAYLLFTRPTLSYISVGTYSLTILILCVSLLVLNGSFSLSPLLNRAKPAVLLVGSVSALFVMTYTGVFLQSMDAVALWDSPWLVVLFVLSALSTGIALVMMSSIGLCLNRTNTDILQRLEKADLAIIVFELIACAACMVSVSSSDLGARSVERLLVGDNALPFMAGFVLCGTLVPGVVNAVSIRRRHGEWVDLTIAFLVLTGGFCLRLSMVGAGIHTSI